MSRRQHFDEGATPPDAMEWQRGQHVFLYTPPTHPMGGGMHRLSLFKGNDKIGGLNWDTDGRVDWVGVDEHQQRKGHGTRLWKEAQHLATEYPGVPAPVHDVQQTPAGEQWSKKVGGEQVSRPVSKIRIIGMRDA